MDTNQDAPAAPAAGPAPPRADSRRSPSPPGTILAAGLMVGLAIVDLGLLILIRPGRFLPPDPWTRMTGLVWFFDVLTLGAELTFLICGFGLLLHGSRWVPRALVVVVARGLVAFVGIALGERMLGGFSGEHTDISDHVKLSTLAWETLTLFVLLFGVWWALRRRGGRPVNTVLWRRFLMIAEGLVACAFVGMMTYVAADVTREIAGLRIAQAPRDAVGAARIAGDQRGGESAPKDVADADDGAEDDGGAGDLMPKIDPALFRNHLDAVGGGSKPLWEHGPSATLVDFWASWCPPCLAELPDLEAVQERLAGRGVKVVIVNVDLGDRARTAKFLERKGIRLGGLVDRDGVLFQALGLQALPSTFVLDAEGRPVRFFEGAPSPQELETALLRANEVRVRHTFQ